jgi:hypothetical protein
MSVTRRQGIVITAPTMSEQIPAQGGGGVGAEVLECLNKENRRFNQDTACDR